MIWSLAILLFTLGPVIEPSDKSPPTALRAYKGKYQKNARFLRFAKHLPKYRAKALKQIEKRLGIAPEDDGIIKIVFEDALKADAATIQIFRGPPFSTFWNEDDNQIVIRLYTEFIVNRRYDARRELTHEMAHAVMRERMDRSDYQALPTWLSEGLALWAAEQVESRILAIHRDLTARTSQATLFAGLEVGVHTLERYPEDVLAIEHIARGKGNTEIKKLVRMLVDGAPAHKAVESVTGRRWRDFKADSRRHSLQRFRELQPPETTRYWKIVDLHKRGKFSTFKKESAGFLREFPKSIYRGDVLYWRGKTYRLMKNVTQAENALHTMIRRYPFQSSYVEEALYQLGSVQLESGRSKKAIVYFKKMLKDHPDSVFLDRAVYNLAVCYSRLGKNDEAIRFLDLFLRSFPRSQWIDKARRLLAILRKREQHGT